MTRRFPGSDIPAPDPTGQTQQSAFFAEQANVFAASMSSTLRREFWVLSRSRNVLAASVAICLLVAAIYNYGTRPLYDAVSVVSLKEAGVSRLRAPSSDQTRIATALREQVSLLKSPELALVAVTGSDPAIVQELSKGYVGDWKERIAEETRFRLGLVKPRGSEPAEMVESFISRLSVEYTPPAVWVHVRLRGYDAAATAMAVNRLIDVYLEETAKRTEAAAGEARLKLEERVAKSQERVSETLGKLEELESKTGLQNVDVRRAQLSAELARLQDSLMTVRQRRLSAGARLTETQRLSPSETLAIQSVRDDPELSTLANRISDIEAGLARSASSLGDRHPEIVGLRTELDLTRKRLNERMKAKAEAAQLDLRTAAREEGDLNAAIQRAQSELARLGRNSLEVSFAQKEAEAGQSVVGDLITEKAREAEAEVFFDPVVVQKARPAAEPISPQRTRNFQYALGIGLLIGLSLAWLRAHLDETIRTPLDVKANIGLPLLGMVPHSTAPALNVFQADDGTMTQLFEAYRVLRTNLSAGAAGPESRRLVLLTSAREGEGKTTTTCGLGIAMARAGQRVLLIDGDLRRGSMSRALFASHRRGVTDAVEGWPIKECISRASVGGLSLMPSGRRVANVDEILNRENLMDILESVRAEFDWILCDAPPVLAVADAAILARLADLVVLVVAANTTPIGSIHATLDQLEAVGANVRGVVLNNVDLGRDSHYYKYYYSAQYGDYTPRTDDSPVRGPDAQAAGPKQRRKA